jgi:Major Facilitator Superfamily
VPRSDLVRAMSYVSLPALLGPVTGPPLGGFIATYGSWRWIFFINIPIGLIGITLINLFIEDFRETGGGRPFDFRGFVLTGVGLASLAFGFETIGRGAVPAVVTAGMMAIGAICMMLYGRHARRVEFPVIDLTLMRIPTYAAATIGGFLFRMGMGALPFLLPLMLQVGFGLSALNSGLLTFASAAGAMTMKLGVNQIIRTLGFRNVLVGNAVISAGFLFIYALFTPSTPHFLIFTALLAGGFFRSLQMTSINSLGYADVPAGMLSRATSLTSMCQQLSQTVGVATGAMFLYILLAMRGETHLTPLDFSIAFAGVACIGMLSVPFFLRMSPDAGAEVSGRGKLVQS